MASLVAHRPPPVRTRTATLSRVLVADTLANRDTASRLMDLVVFEGKPAVFRAGLALLALHEREIILLAKGGQADDGAQATSQVCAGCGYPWHTWPDRAVIRCVWVWVCLLQNVMRSGESDSDYARSPTPTKQHTEGEHKGMMPLQRGKSLDEGSEGGFSESGSSVGDDMSGSYDGSSDRSSTTSDVDANHRTRLPVWLVCGCTPRMLTL